MALFQLVDSLDEQTLDLAYDEIRGSELENSLPTNAAIDAKAVELAGVIQEAIEKWFKKERQAEKGKAA